MDLSRLAPGARPVDGPEAGRPRPTGPPGPVGRVAPALPASARPDRMELSEAARAHQAEASARQAEVESARAGLADLDALPEGRVAELRARLAEGYYDSPEVADALATRLAGLGQGLPPSRAEG